MTDAALLKLVEILRLFVSAVGFWASLSIWLFCRGVTRSLIVSIRQMFAAVAIVLFVASGANLLRVAYGTTVFLEAPLLQLAVVLLYAAMTGTAVRFFWHLTKG